MMTVRRWSTVAPTMMHSAPASCSFRPLCYISLHFFFFIVEMSAEKKKVVETSAKDDERKPQREAPRSAANATPSAAVQRPRRQQQPRKVRNPAKVGKANLKRDIPLFLGLVGFLFFVAWLSSGIGGTNELEKKKSIKELQDDLRKQFEVQQAREQARKRTTECDLFLASSSIPGAGVGVFAGKQFQVGEEVVS